MTELEMKRDPSGRFVKGESGNPNGRPVGVKNYGTAQTLLELFRELTPRALSDLQDRYEAGDENAREFILRRVWPESPMFSAALHSKSRAVDMQEERNREIEELKQVHAQERARFEERHEEALQELELEMDRLEDDLSHKFKECIFRSKTKAIKDLPGFFQSMFYAEIDETMRKKLCRLSACGPLDDAMLPGFGKLSVPNLSSFSHAMIYGVIYEPDTVRDSLVQLGWPENLITTAFEEIQKKYNRHKIRDMIAASIVYPCLASNKTTEEIQEILGARMDVGSGQDEDGKPAWEI